jgi:hypothetical protein
MPTASLNKNSHTNPYLNDSDRAIFTFYRLMRQLPDDITNASPLTFDQTQMAFAVAFYAREMHEILVRGLVEISRLMPESDSEYGDGILALGQMIRHLNVEAEFMQEVASDYRDVALEYCAKYWQRVGWANASSAQHSTQQI